MKKLAFIFLTIWGDSKGQCIALSNIGNIEYRLENYDKAIHIYRALKASPGSSMLFDSNGLRLVAKSIYDLLN
jgi:hypothetical protein